jgi:hypothetical protein
MTDSLKGLSKPLSSLTHEDLAHLPAVSGGPATGEALDHDRSQSGPRGSALAAVRRTALTRQPAAGVRHLNTLFAWLVNGLPGRQSAVPVAPTRPQGQASRDAMPRVPHASRNTTHACAG